MSGAPASDSAEVRTTITQSAYRGGFADPARDAARAFRAVLDAMARPGRIVQLSGVVPPPPLPSAAAALVLTLVDEAAPVYLAGTFDRAEIRAWVAVQTGARCVEPAAAAFALGTWDALLPLERFACGTREYPDRSATLIVTMAALAPPSHRLRGPGIDGTAEIALPGPEAMTFNTGRFPQGIDFMFVCVDQLCCLPRSSRVERL